MNEVIEDNTLKSAMERLSQAQTSSYAEVASHTLYCDGLAHSFVGTEGMLYQHAERLADVKGKPVRFTTTVGDFTIFPEAKPFWKKVVRWLKGN